MSSIPASIFANVVPSVLGAGGTAIDITALVLTNGTRVPIGSVLSFSSGLAVSSYFGATSPEAVIANGAAGKGSGYFGGFTGSNKLPAALLFAQYNMAPVSAFLRGASIASLTLAQIQALNALLNVTVDGSLKTATINLAAATSFSNAAQLIAEALEMDGVQTALVTASQGATFTGTGSGTNLTTSAVTGVIHPGDAVTGTGVPGGTTIVSQTSGATGGAGVYVTSQATTSAGASLTSTSTTIEVTAVTSGTIGTNQVISGAGVTDDTYVTALGTGTGGVGNYVTNTAQQYASQAVTARLPGVVFDSVSGAIVFTSGTTGAASTITFGSGALAASLLLTSAAGAVLSQGAVAAVPATFMNAVVAQTTNWVTFMTSFDPDGGIGSAVKQALAAWKNSQGNRYAYVCWDTDASPRTSLPAPASLGAILAANGDSGTFLIDELTDLNQAAFACGAAASIDFTQTSGRITFAFKGQAGLVADVTDPTTALNLGGDPRVPGSLGNGYNYYGAVGPANASFNWLQRGTVTGPFAWFDSYINQVWLNNGFQSALLNLFNNSRSIPYSTSGAGLIESALTPQITAGLNFGAFAPGTISASQIAAVNAAAGANIAGTLQTQGYYLQILQATSAVRAARASPPCTFWYLDRGSVQSISLASVALQ